MTLDEVGFYNAFRTAIGTATKTVAISHLDTKAPLRVPGTAEADYYRAFHRLVRLRNQVRFRRIERLSKDKVAWIEEFMARHKGRTNFSLACLNDEPTIRKLPYVSVQIVDDSLTYLVAIAEHYGETHPKRDLVIHDVDAAALWRAYYQQLWDRADVVIDAGKVDEAAWRALKRRLGTA